MLSKLLQTCSTYLKLQAHTSPVTAISIPVVIKKARIECASIDVLDINNTDIDADIQDRLNAARVSEFAQRTFVEPNISAPDYHSFISVLRYACNKHVVNKQREAWLYYIYEGDVLAYDFYKRLITNFTAESLDAAAFDKQQRIRNKKAAVYTECMRMATNSAHLDGIEGYQYHIPDIYKYSCAPYTFYSKFGFDARRLLEPLLYYKTQLELREYLFDRINLNTFASFCWWKYELDIYKYVEFRFFEGFSTHIQFEYIQAERQSIYRHIVTRKLEKRQQRLISRQRCFNMPVVFYYPVDAKY